MIVAQIYIKIKSMGLIRFLLGQFDLIMDKIKSLIMFKN
jgi:hypothetical protein